ncbi:MAG TPA: PGPGW domain-containing protein [Planctomycetaceae bacterium]|nr:PGPGW domain-containing protein [Planctomycetaceae bacterium]
MTEHPKEEAGDAPPAADPPAAAHEVHTVLPLPWAIWFWAQARKIVVAVIGTTVILAGVAMLVLPGPGWLAIFGGLAILATEFAWAKWMLKYAKKRMSQLAEKYVGLGATEKSPSSKPQSRDPAKSA